LYVYVFVCKKERLLLCAVDCCTV